MKLPPFSDFQENVNFDELGYDIEQFAPNSLKNPNPLFTQEQYLFLCQTMATMNIAMLQQYHSWLAEQLP